MGYVKTKLKKELSISSIITIHYFEYPLDFSFRGEEHDFWEFLYVDRGSIHVTAGESKHILTNGDVIFHEPMEFHAFDAIGEKPPNLAVMSFACDAPVMNFFRQGVFRLTAEERTIISKIIDVATECFSTPINVPSVEQVILKENHIPGQPQMISLYLEQFLLTLYQRIQWHPIRHPKNYMVEDADFLSDNNMTDRIVKFMGENITQKLTLDELCSTFQISRSSLEALFVQEKNCAPIKYFYKMKIDKAKELIREGILDITEIAHYLAFSSVQHLSLKFKKVTGLSPKEYQTSVRSLSPSSRKPKGK